MDWDGRRFDFSAGDSVPEVFLADDSDAAIGAAALRTGGFSLELAGGTRETFLHRAQRTLVPALLSGTLK